MNPTVDRTNRTFQIEVLVPNAERRLKPGNFAKAAIMTHQDSNAITVPTEALVAFAGVSKVFVVQEGKAHAVEVRLGERGDGWLEVLGDLTEGASVVTSGQTQLAEGTTVRVRADETKAPAVLSRR
jgi:RND family efflux transporter MFP subunit